jgi:CRP-like cAMP-binding protein
VNFLIEALTGSECTRLKSHFEQVELELGQSLTEPEQPITHVYFPTNSLVSVIQMMRDGASVESGMIGREGMVGLQAWLGQTHASVRSVVQAPGQALRMRREVFLHEVVNAHSSWNSVIAKYIDSYITLLTITAACNRIHQVNERLCRWLKMTQNRVGRDSFPMRQEFMAHMLGVHRPSVSIAANALKKAGLIRYERGIMTVLDSERLEKNCCECYRAIESQFERALKVSLRKGDHEPGKHDLHGPPPDSGKDKNAL